MDTTDIKCSACDRLVARLDTSACAARKAAFRCLCGAKVQVTIYQGGKVAASAAADMLGMPPTALAAACAAKYTDTHEADREFLAISSSQKRQYTEEIAVRRSLLSSLEVAREPVRERVRMAMLAEAQAARLTSAFKGDPKAALAAAFAKLDAETQAEIMAMFAAKLGAQQ